MFPIIYKCLTHLELNLEEQIMFKSNVWYGIERIFGVALGCMSHLSPFWHSYGCLKFQNTICLEIEYMSHLSLKKFTIFI
jgi:hypothetical protein